jgi:Glycosyl transferase family 11
MIVCKIYGGMGNQMFQYCLGRHLAILNDCQLKLELGYFGSEKSWPFRLDHFETHHAGVATPAEISGIHARDGVWRKLLPASLRVVARDKNERFQPEVLKFKADCLLDGYWQSEKYFKGIEHVLRDELQIKSELLSDEYHRVLGRVREATSVSLAVRRGDYISLGAPLATVDFYQRAIDELKKFVSDPTLVVFSDDIAWVKDNLTVDLPVMWIDQDLGLHDFERMQLMSECKHHIIANSTFSWWGAWLNRDQGKRVIYPEVALSHLNRDLMLADWIQL